MNLSDFHKGHVGDGDGDLPAGPSGLSDDSAYGRPPSRYDDRPRYEDDAPSRADEGDWRPSGGGRRPDRGFNDRARGGFDAPPSRSDEAGSWRMDRGGGGGGDRPRGDVRALDRDPRPRGDDRAPIGGGGGGGGGAGGGGYRHLQLKKKGEAPPSSSESRRAEGGGKSETRDVVRIHKAEAPEKEEKETKREKEERETKSVPDEPVKSALDQALEDKQPVTVAELSEGIAALKLTEDSRESLTEVLTKSLIGKKMGLKDAVTVLESKLPKEAANLTVGLLQAVKQKKGDAFLLSTVQASGLNILEVIAKQGTELDSLLTEKDLQCLMPELNRWVSTSFAEGKLSVDAILDHIKQNTEPKQSLASLGPLVADNMARVVFKDPAKPNVDSITSFAKLLRRTVSEPKSDVKAQTAVLFAVQNVWSEAKMPKGSLVAVFTKLHHDKLIAWEAFDAWREDRDNKTPNKHKALVQVNAFLESIKPKGEVEEDDEAEGDEEEDGEEDEE